MAAILGDPGADSRDDGGSKKAGKNGTKKSKERREEHLDIVPEALLAVLFFSSCHIFPPV